MRNLTASVCMLAALLAGCGGPPPIVSNGSLQVTADKDLPEPTRGDFPAIDRPSVLGAFDKLSVTVVGLPELSLEEVQIDATGRLSTPLAGSMMAAGRTPAELSAMIIERLRAAYVRSPQVVVNVKEMVSHTFTVDGSVVEPGLYPAIGDMSLMKAVATAKGLGEFAKLDDVVVFRTVNNQRMAALYNLSAIRRGQYGDPKIYANDVIVVGNSSARRLFKDFVSLSPLIAGPIIALLQRR
jgi:polysaccharide biosynthesis/export protein